MQIVRVHGTLPEPLRGRVVAVGNFDGVHLGHRRLLAEAARAAGTSGGGPAVLTFEPHPLRVLRPERAPRRLTLLRGKARRLRAAGVRALYLQRFTPGFAARSADEFVEGTLRGALGARHVVVGHDFRFGAGRAGDAATLREASRVGAFGLTVVDPVADGAGTAYASTLIRRAVGEGRMDDAARDLGAPWEAEGRVVPGAKRGRLLGFPTANLAYGALLAPADGVYAAWAGVPEDGGVRWRAAAVSSGVRPQFGAGRRLLEAHILDFGGNLYGRRLRVAFVEFLRPERTFPSANALVQAMAADVRRVREALDGREPPPGDA